MKIEKGCKAFITGAASGIGRSTAIAMGKRGAKLFLTDRNENGLKETVEMISKGGGEVCKYKAFDISQYEAVKAFADEIHKEYGPVDIVMNVAGVALFAQIEDMTHEHWKKVININLWGPIHGIECFVPEMIRAGKGGHLATVASTAGICGLPWHAAYSTTKFGLVGVSEVLRLDLMRHNIGVTVVCPGAVDTPMKQSAELIGINRESKYIKKKLKQFSEHAVTPERVAELMIRGVEKNKFLVITSTDIKIMYFLKKKCFPLYHLILKKVSVMMNRAREA